MRQSTKIFTSRNLVKNSIIVSISLFLVEVFLLLSSAWLDGNYFLEGDDLGLFEHKGIFVILLGDLFILIVTSLMVSTTLKVERKFPLQKRAKSRRYLRRCKNVVILILEFGTPFRKVAIYTFFVALAFWLNNAYQTTLPEKYYGNDVFDSSRHLFSYISVRFVLASSWLFLYPLSLYASLACCLALYKMFKNRASKNDMIFDVHHFDRCGGYSFFGEINFYFVLIILILYIELTIVLFTHGQLNIGIVAGFLFTSTLLIGGSVFFIYPVLQYLRQKKTYLIGMHYRKLKKAGYCKNLLEYKWITESLTFSPYFGYQKAVISIARFSPVVTAVVKLSS